MAPRARRGPDYRPPARISDADFRRLADDADAAVVAVDADARIFEVNRAAEDLLGWPRDRLLGEDLVCIIPIRFQERHRAGFARYLATHQSRFVGTTMNLPLLRADGTELDVVIELLAFSVGDVVGVPREVLVGMLRPGTDRPPGS